MDISDKKIVKKLERKEKDVRLQELNDVRTVLSNASGMRFMWRLLEQCNVFGELYSKDTSRLYYRTGKRDCGLFIMSEITEADENLLLKLMKNNRRKKDE